MTVTVTPSTIAPGGTVTFDHNGGGPVTNVVLFVGQMPGTGEPINGGGFQPGMEYHLPPTQPAVFSYAFVAPSQPGQFAVYMRQDGGFTDSAPFTVSASAPAATTTSTAPTSAPIKPTSAGSPSGYLAELMASTKAQGALVAGVPNWALAVGAVLAYKFVLGRR